MSFFFKAVGAIFFTLVSIATGFLAPSFPASDVASTTTPAATSSSTRAVAVKVANTGSTEKTTAATTVVKTAATVPTKKLSPASAVAAASPSVAMATSSDAWDDINSRTRAALVNIICTSASGGLVDPISASGVIIDPRGVILTNAHVALYYLIKDYPSKGFLDCMIRQGSPASARYHANLLYISPEWVSANYKDILEQTPIGTGEDDFALLVIASTTNPNASLPTSFPFVAPSYLDTQNIIGAPVLISAYPAGFLGGASIQTSLYLSTAAGAIQGIFSFASTSVDLLSLGGSVVAQHGSSGGAVVTGDGKLMGIIVTSTDAATTGGRDLNAITLSYINRELARETSVGLPSFLAGDVNLISDEFNQTVTPALRDLVVRYVTTATR